MGRQNPMNNPLALNEGITRVAAILDGEIDVISEEYADSFEFGSRESMSGNQC
jgi:hypothetical protein